MAETDDLPLTRSLYTLHEWALIERARADGKRRILREIAKLPSPCYVNTWWHYEMTTLRAENVCRWCNAKWETKNIHGLNQHPANGCLWARALAAQEDAT